MSTASSASTLGLALRAPRRSMRVVPALLLVFGAASFAAEPRLLVDLDVTPVGSLPASFEALGDRVFFSANRSDVGREIWVSDGTADGTRLLVDANPGPASSFPESAALANDTGSMITAGDRLYFVAITDRIGARLWRTVPWPEVGLPATPGALAEPLVGTDTTGVPSGPTILGALGNRVVFEANDGIHGSEPWITDGTAEGTHLVADLEPGFAGSRRGSMTVFGSHAYFTAATRDTGFELWKTDGTAAGTQRLTDLAPGPAPGVDPASSGVYTSPHGVVFIGCTLADGCDPWISDGTPAGTRRLYDLEPDPSPNQRYVLIPAEGAVFIQVNPYELWVTDGTTAGTRLVLRGTRMWEPPVAVGSRVFFGAGGGDGFEPWVSDGTLAGTRQVDDLALGWSSTPMAFAAFGGRAVFSADVPGLGRELWITDGTATGTTLVADIAPGEASSTPVAMAAGGRVWMRADDLVTGSEPWISDGTSGGTRRVVDLDRERTESFRPLLVTTVGELLVFRPESARVDDPGSRFSVTDGTAVGTAPMPDPPGFEVESPTAWATVGDRFYFTARSRASEWAMLRFDADGTIRRLDLGPMSSRSAPRNLTVVGGRLFYTRVLGGELELWRLSESDRGVFVASLLTARPAVASEDAPRLDASPDFLPTEQLVPFGDALAVFVVETDLTIPVGPDDPEWLWISDGTPAGTRRVSRVEHLTAGSIETAVVADRLLFVGHDAAWGTEPWVTDGTAVGTRPLGDLTPGPATELDPEIVLVRHQGRAFFRLSSGDIKCIPLWRSDSTPEGTEPVLDCVGAIVEAGGQLFAGGSYLDRESLYRLVGDPLRKESVMGHTNARAESIVGVDPTGVVYLVAHDPVHGRELWRTDGTPFSARLVGDIHPGLGDSGITRALALGGAMLLAADDGVHGSELFTVPLECVPSFETKCLVDGRFQVRARWLDVAGSGSGGMAGGFALTDEAAGLYFFSPDYLDLVTKVHDGRGINGHYWTFAASLSDVQFELDLLDTSTGAVDRYFQPAGRFTSGANLQAFSERAAPSPRGRPSVVESRTFAVTPVDECAPTASTLCLGVFDRFRVTVVWRDELGRERVGIGREVSPSSGTFWYFSPDNVEVAVNVIDGRAVNDHFWVVFGSLSNLELTLQVENTATGRVRTYHSPHGSFVSFADITAFGPSVSGGRSTE